MTQRKLRNRAVPAFMTVLATSLLLTMQPKSVNAESVTFQASAVKPSPFLGQRMEYSATAAPQALADISAFLKTHLAP